MRSPARPNRGPRTARSFALLLAAALLAGGCDAPRPSARGAAPTREVPAGPERATPGAGEWRRVERVVDGDTVVLEGGERVRLIGVDTAEMGDERPVVRRFARASRRGLERLLRGQRVRLEYGRERTDRHGRTLAYLFTENGDDVNRAMIEAGWSHAFTRYPHPELEAHRAAEREARVAGRGLWSDSLADWREALRE